MTSTTMGASLAHRTLLSEWRALLAVAKKEWIIFRRYPSWVVAYVIWPGLFPLRFIFTAKALGGGESSPALAAFTRLTGTTDYGSYLILGSAMWMWLNLMLWDVGFHLRSEQMRGTLESNWLCPVWRISIMLGASLTKLVSALLFLVTTAVECRLLYGIQLLQGNMPLMLLLLLLLIPSIYGIGLAFASLVMQFKEANTMVFLVRGIFMLFCGISFPVEVLPEWMRGIAAFLPLTYAIRGMREAALAGATTVDLLPDLQRLAIFAVVFPLVGGTAFALTERQARQSGSLGQY